MSKKNSIKRVGAYMDYLEAVRQSGWALYHVPEALKTPEFMKQVTRYVHNR